jgi:hypothetical protein
MVVKAPDHSLQIICEGRVPRRRKHCGRVFLASSLLSELHYDIPEAMVAYCDNISVCTCPGTQFITCAQDT